MATPPPPIFKSQPGGSVLAFTRLAKTPKHQNQAQCSWLRSKSELQPNRMSSRFVTNIKPYTVQSLKKPEKIDYQVHVNGKLYKIVRKIGTGGSAKVYEGYDPTTCQTYAIKIINVAQADQSTRESYFNEISLLSKLNDSKHVVRMYDHEYKSDFKELIIVMEKGDTDLSRVIEKKFRKLRKNMIDVCFIRQYWREMVQAVNDIHQHGVVHSDLKPVNFILVETEVKLIDFGIASAVDPEGTSIIRDHQIGTINYMAPESLRNRALDASFDQLSLKTPCRTNYNNNHRDSGIGSDSGQPRRKTVIKYNSKADIWSLGCILYYLVYGKPPFDEYKDVLSKAQAITNPRHIIEFRDISNSNLNLLECMKSCLRYNPTDRPTANDLLEHPFLREGLAMIR